VVLWMLAVQSAGTRARPPLASSRRALGEPWGGREERGEEGSLRSQSVLLTICLAAGGLPHVRDGGGGGSEQSVGMPAAPCAASLCHLATNLIMGDIKHEENSELLPFASANCIFALSYAK